MTLIETKEHRLVSAQFILDCDGIKATLQIHIHLEVHLVV